MRPEEIVDARQSRAIRRLLQLPALRTQQARSESVQNDWLHARDFGRLYVAVSKAATVNLLIGDPGRGEFRLVVTLYEKTAGVAKNVGPKLPHSRQRCGDCLQENGPPRRKFVRKVTMKL